MSYVDLNPVRAAIADTPEVSDYTSIQARIRAWSEGASEGAESSTAADEDADHSTGPPPLLPFRGPDRKDAPDHLPFAFADYLQLVDWAGRAVRDDKRGAIAEDAPPILIRFGIDPDTYLDRMGRRRPGFIRAMGRAERLREAATELGQHFVKGISEAKALFPASAG